MSLSLDTAREIVAGVLAEASNQKWQPLAVVVLDTGGHLICAERQDGASYGRIDIARAKAEGALALGVGSRALMTRAEDQAYFVITAARALSGGLVPVPGGVLVRGGDGEILGAVGVSGDLSDHDEAAAVAGIQRVGLTAQVGGS